MNDAKVANGFKPALLSSERTLVSFTPANYPVRPHPDLWPLSGSTRAAWIKNLAQGHHNDHHCPHQAGPAID